MRRKGSSFFPVADGSVVRKNTNLSLPEVLVSEARSLGVNLSRACERGLAEEIAERRAARWLEENREALAEWNDFIEKKGVPLARFRQF